MEGRKSTVFCIECGDDREYKILTRRTAVEVRGVHFSYLELVAVCEGWDGVFSILLYYRYRIYGKEKSDEN